MKETMEELQDALDYQVISAKNAMRAKAEQAKEVLTSEAGAVDIVVILLIVVVAIALVAVFREQIMKLITNVFGKLNDAVDNVETNLDATTS